MDVSFVEGQLNIILPEKINAENAATFEKELFAIEQLGEAEGILLDAEKLTYISSLGLRVILKLLKKLKGTSLIVVNASDEIYNVFEVTGMSSFILIAKKLRHVDLKSLKILGSGMYGSVYRINNEQILKVFHNINSMPKAKKLLDIMRLAFMHGIPTIMPFDVVQTEKGVGVILELLASNLMSVLIRENPEKIDKYITDMVELAKILANTKFDEGELRSRNEVLISKLDSIKDIVSPEEITTMTGYINAIPRRNTAVHGDFHAKNLMISEDKPILIDMDEFSCGHPIWDVANANFIYQVAAHTDPVIADDLYDINGKMPFEEFYFKMIGCTTSGADIIWDKFFNGYFAEYSPEEKKSILELVEFYGEFRYVDVLIDLCDLFKDNPKKLAGKVKLIRDFLAKLKTKNLDELLEALDYWK